MADDQEADRRAKASYQKRVNGEIDAAISACLNTSNGRRLLWWILELGHINQQPFTSNALSTAFQCGELNVGNQVLARIMEVNPDGYLTMMKEKALERTALDTNAAVASDPGA